MTISSHWLGLIIHGQPHNILCNKAIRYYYRRLVSIISFILSCRWRNKWRTMGSSGSDWDGGSNQMEKYLIRERLYHNCKCSPYLNHEDILFNKYLDSYLKNLNLHNYVLFVCVLKWSFNYCLTYCCYIGTSYITVLLCQPY